MTRSHLAEGTYIDTEELAYPAGSLNQSHRRARALCSDGIVRTFTIGIPDTYFSIPARGKVKGKTVTGWISVATKSGLSTATDDDPARVEFHAKGINADILPRWEPKTYA